MTKKRIFITAAAAILGLSLVGAASADTIDAVGKSMPQKAQQAKYMAQDDHEPMKGFRLTDEITEDNGTTTETVETSSKGSNSNSTMQSEKGRTMQTKGKEEQRLKMNEENMKQMEQMAPMHNDTESMQELMETMHESMPNQSTPHQSMNQNNDMSMHSGTKMEPKMMKNHMKR